jgi:hypothetical protein
MRPGSNGDQEWAKVSSPPAGAFQVQISVIRHTECAIASACSSVFCLGSIPTLQLHQLLVKKKQESTSPHRRERKTDPRLRVRWLDRPQGWKAGFKLARSMQKFCEAMSQPTPEFKGAP